MDKAPIQVLDKGFVRVVDWMGDDNAIVDAARVSYANMNEVVEQKDARRLIRYLMRNKHTSPFEQVELKLHVKLPIFVARQWIRHRMASVNEISGRYVELEEEFYIPTSDQVCYQATDNKQGRSGPLPEDKANRFIDNLNGSCGEVYNEYMYWTKTESVAKETARMLLPLNLYTQWYWKIDGHNLLHFLNLRMHEHAQWEIRQYGIVIANLVKQWLPLTWEAFNDYVLEAYTLSRMEKEVIIEKLARMNWAHMHFLLKSKGCTKREIEEFKKVILGLSETKE